MLSPAWLEVSRSCSLLFVWQWVNQDEREIMLKKALALGSGLALAATGLVAAAPAAAAGELQLEVASGSLYAVPHTADIELRTSVTAGNDSDELVNLKYKVEAAGGFEVLVDSDDAADGAAPAKIMEDTDTSKVFADAAFAAGDLVNFISISVAADGGGAFAATADSVSVTVTAWVDKDADDVVDANEWSAARTVTFMDSDLINLSTALTQPVLNDQTVAAKVTSTNINLAQAGVFSVTFTGDGVGVGTASETDATGSYAAATDDLSFATTDVVDGGGDVADNTKVPGTVVGGNYRVQAGTFTAQAKIGAVAVGNQVARVVAATTVATLTPTIAAGSDNEAAAGNDTDIRSGAGSVSVTVKAATGAGAGVKDKTVSVTLAENAANSLAAAASVSINGVSFANTAAGSVQSKTVSVTTDADGEATLTISYSGVAAADVLKMTASVDGIAMTAQTFTAEAAVATTVSNTNVIGTSAELVVAKSTDFVLSYVLLDQFNELFTATGHTVQVNDDNNNPVWSGAFSGGYANVSIPGYAANGTQTMDATVYKGLVAAAGATTTTELTVGAQDAPSAIAIAAIGGDSFGAANNKQNLMLKAWSNADTRLGQSAPTVANGITAQVTITDQFNVVTPASVTLSGDNLMFGVDGKVFASGSVTTVTTAAGVATVEVYSNTAGKQVLTVTSGGVTKTQDIYFADAADDTGYTLSLDTPASILPGRTLVITGSLVDKFGNPVTADGTDEDFVLTYSGPGYKAAAPTAISADGSFTWSILLGSNDTGTATVTAAYDLDEDGDYTDTGDLVVTKSVIIGTVAADTKVNAGSFKGYVAIYAKGHEGKRLSAKVGNDWVVVPALASNFVRVVEYTGAGYTIAVRIYIDRVLVDTITVTTK